MLRFLLLLLVLAFLLGLCSDDDRPQRVEISPPFVPLAEDNDSSDILLLLAVATSLRPKARPKAVTRAAARFVPKAPVTAPVAQPAPQPAYQPAPPAPESSTRRKRKKR